MTPYKKKLLDPRWDVFRKHILARDNYSCMNCANINLVLHVHHTYYDLDLEPWEYDINSMVTLCEHCHEEHHRTDKAMNKVLIDAVNKCFVDKYGKLMLSAAFEAMAIKLSEREYPIVISNFDIEALCLALFNPGISEINKRQSILLMDRSRASNDEQSFFDQYDLLSKKYSEVIHG